MSKPITPEARLKVFKKYHGHCAYCGDKISYKSFQVDHINPLWRGHKQERLNDYNILKGCNGIDNLNPSCRSCNSSKSTWTIEQWRRELYLKVNRIRRDSSQFRILERYGLVKVNPQDILFHFEKTPF